MVKISKKNFPSFGVLGHQKHPYVGRILKKPLQGSIHALFYMAINGPFGRFLLQPCTGSVKVWTYRYGTTLSRIISKIIDAKTLVIMELIYINFKKLKKILHKFIENF